jgi:hypothetical protein
MNARGKRRLTLAAIGLIAVLALCTAAGVVLLHARPRIGASFENWTDDSGTFPIRVTAYNEAGIGPVPSAYYKFESGNASKTQWREIATFRHDDPLLIPREQVRRIDDKVAYLFMGWMYAVTTDGGQSWAVWSAERDLPGWQCCNYRLIGDVALNGDGTGTMTCNVIDSARGEVPKLLTRDFGRTWTRP